ncbi:small kinetochore-associated protein [Spea bombifrons]|uniref:small kinetochore-associated protein n=1 Tax=Spea bombifrons TaxID=233779 RepID=UPI0023497D74|nr:small kinetochore-associated protein [Spea bombifrons]
MERSKIPVFKTQPEKKPTTTDAMVPCPKKICPQKQVLPLYSKDPNIAFSSNTAEMGVFKAVSNGKRNAVPRRAPGPIRGPVNRYKVEAELRDNNQLLQAANVSLHSKLTTAQESMNEMAECQEALREEVKELKVRLEKNMIILENRNIDPVSGERILASAEETLKQKAETRHFTDKLIEDLQRFSQMAGEQKTVLQTLKGKWEEVDKDRSQFVEEQEAFQREMEQFRASLEEANQWLAK